MSSVSRPAEAACKADEVGEQHADEPALCDGSGRPRGPCRRGRRDGSAALAAEPVTGLERRAAREAPARKRSAAGRAELRPSRLLPPQCVQETIESETRHAPALVIPSAAARHPTGMPMPPEDSNLRHTV